MSGLLVNILRVEDKYGVKQLAYEMNYEYLTEVLAGLRHRCGPPLGATVDIDRRSGQQQWIWHIGEDVIIAVKTEERSFVLS